MSVEQRFIGLDVHKRSIMVAGVNHQQEVVLKPVRVAIERFESWSKVHLHREDKVVLETTSNTWVMYDQLLALNLEVVVANSHKIKLISSSRTKTDKQDALVLAKLLAANLVPEVWVPPAHVRELRRLSSHYRQLVRDRTAAKNRLHSVLGRNNLQLPEGNPFHPENQGWWSSLAISAIDQLCIRHDLMVLQQLEQFIADVEVEMTNQSVTEPWSAQAAFLIQFPGVGVYSAITILSAIGEIERFEDAKSLVGYSGLGSSIYASGDTQRTGGITKQGRRELRTTLIESAWAAVRHSAYWRQQYQKLLKQKEKNKAIVIIARKLLVAMWHCLSKRQADLHADPAAVGRSFFNWAAYHRIASRSGLSRPEFIWRELDRIGLGQTMSEFAGYSRIIQRPAPAANAVA